MSNKNKRNLLPNPSVIQRSRLSGGLNRNIHSNVNLNVGTPRQNQNAAISIPRPNYSHRPYFSDPLIVSRVAQYMENNSHSVVIDFNDMADQMQRDFREYRRRKRPALIYQLKKALEVVNYEYGLNQNNDGESELIDDDEEEEFVRGRKSPNYAFEGDGDINSTLEDSYLQNAKKSRKIDDTADQELISIVTSDEDNNDEDVPEKAIEEKISEPPPKKKVAKRSTQNGEVTSTPAVKPPAVEAQTAKKRKMESGLLGSKRFKSSLEPVRPKVTFKDIGGNEKVLQEVTQLLVHLRHPEVYRVLGVSPPRGFLLHGPPGSGKTLLAHAISGELKLPLLKVAAPELVGGLSGQSEERIRDLFEQAVALAPCIMFIDEVDAITPNREMAHREMERRIVAQLLSSLDELSNHEKGDQVLVIGATNRPDSLDPALRRAGRFDREVCLGIPDRESRASILQTLCKTLRLAPDLQLSEVAMMTPGFVGADLKSLVTEAAMAAVNRLFKSLMHSEEGTESKSTQGPETLGVPNSKTNIKEEKECDQSMDVNITKSSIEGEELEIFVDTTGEHKEDIDEDPSKVTESQPKEKQINNTKNGKSESEVDDMEIQEVSIETEDSSSSEIQCLNEESGPQDKESVNPTKKIPSEGGGTEGEHQPPSLLHSPPLSVEQLEGVFITMDDFKAAMKTVQPSSKREGFVTVPDVKWEDIGSLQDIRHDLQMAILAPVKYPKEFAQIGLHTPTGVLLCGPPGCGKTLLAKAVANEAGINFISVKGPELLNMYVGESERAVRQCFQRARSSQPCVIFFDEIDALCPKRMHMENGASRVVNQLLTEMDGMEARPGVFLMAATNRPDIVDPAVMRPGRLDKVLYVGLPGPEDRVDILRAVTKGGKQPMLAEDVSLAEVALESRCEGYTGADLAALVREASMQALTEHMAAASPDNAPAQLKVCMRHFTTALEKIRPSVSEKDKKRYEDLRLQYAAVPTKSS